MEFIDAILPEFYRTAIGWTILHSIWQIIAISLLLYLVLRICEKKTASFKYNLSFASLLLILPVSSFTFLISLTEAREDHLGTLAVITGSPVSGTANSYSTLSSYFPAEIDHYIPLLVNIWFVGAILFLFRLVNNFSAITGLKKSAKTGLSEQLINFANSKRIKLGILREVSFLTSKYIQCPITFGTIKPIVLIPASLIFHLSPAQLEAIITHELAHIKRNDYLHNIIQSFMEAIFFYHPCFWWINAYIREQRENACDDLAIRMGVAPKDLATGLAEVLNHTQEPSPEMAMAAGGNHHPTLIRIKRMLGFENQKPKFPSLISYTMIFTMLISASLVLGATHVSTLEKDNFLITKAHFTQNIPLSVVLPVDTIPSKKRVFIIDKDDRVLEPDSEAEPLKRKLIIINGDTQRMYLPTKPMIFYRGDSILANIPHLKADSLWMKKFRDFEYDTARIKKFRTYRFDTITLDKETIKRLERSAKDMEIHGKELEQKIHIWTQKNQPKFEELQKKLKEKEILLFNTPEEFINEMEPQLKELERKMEEWQKEFAPKMEELQQKMEIWQQKNSKQLEEIQKAIQESVKKGDN